MCDPMTAADLPPPPTRRDVLGLDLAPGVPGQEGTSAPRWRFHRSRSSHVLHTLGTWASKASAGVTVAGVLLAWGVLGAFTAFPHWWEISLYSSTSAVTVVMLFAVQHTQRARDALPAEFGQRLIDERQWGGRHGKRVSIRARGSGRGRSSRGE